MKTTIAILAITLSTNVMAVWENKHAAMSAFLPACADENDRLYSYCEGFVFGAGTLDCISEEIYLSQMTKIVGQYAEQHPEKLNQSPHKLVKEALTKKLCK